MSDDLKQRIEDCLKDEDYGTAARLLQERAAAIDDADLVKLINLVLIDDEDAIADFYAATIGRVDDDLKKRMHRVLVSVSDNDLLFKTMNEDGAVPFHEALLEQILEELDIIFMDDDLVNMLIQVTKLSKEHRLRVVNAITSEENPVVNDYVTALRVLGGVLDDETLLQIIACIAGDKAEPDDESDGDEEDDEGGGAL